jgi:hypothetical protein
MSASHPFFNKIFIVALILSFFIFIFIPSTSFGENQNNSVYGSGPIPPPKVDNETDKQPQKEPINISEGSGLHLAKFNLTVAIVPDRPLRGNNATINVTFNNTDDERKTLTVQYINIDLLPIFYVTRIYSNEGDDGSYQNRIRIPKFVSEKNKAISFKYDIFIPKNAALDIRNLINHEMFNETDIDGIITIKKCRVDRKDIHLNDDIFIQNNPPIIETANVSIIAHQVTPINNDTLLVSENLSNPLIAIFNISAGDVEDGKNLMYGFILSKVTDSGSKNETPANALSTCGDFSRKISIQPGERYSLYAVVIDRNNTTKIKQANIIYRGDIYKKVEVPGNFLLKSSALILIIFISIVITIFIFRRIGHCPQRVLTKNSVAASIILIWLFFLVLLNASPIKVPVIEEYFIFNTIYAIEFPIYLTIFIIISQFMEKCFYLDDLINYHDNALWANYISSSGILIIFIFIIPEITDILSLSDYYVAMSTVMGTIFALVVTLSTQFPKNIYSSPTMKCFKYVFSWDGIPGKNSNELKKFLTQDSEIKWEKNAKIEKIDNGNTIKVSTREKSLLFKRNSEKNEVILEIYDISTNKLNDISTNKFKLIAMKEKDKLNIYGIYLNLEDIFLYPKVLQYFVELYGATLVISLLGLVTGTHIELNAKIFDPSLANLYSLFSIALFEITFLLIPPTVISLYHLMKVISFRGKITIESKPSGAMVYLSKKREKRNSLVYWLWMKTIENAVKAIPNCFSPWNQVACLIEGPHCLNLCTPCTLMLMKGTYNLELHYERLKTRQETIQIRDSVESEHTIDLNDPKDKIFTNN